MKDDQEKAILKKIANIKFVDYFSGNCELFMYNFNGVHVYLRSNRISLVQTYLFTQSKIYNLNCNFRIKLYVKLINLIFWMLYKCRIACHLDFFRQFQILKCYQVGLDRKIRSVHSKFNCITANVELVCIKLIVTICSCAEH